MDPAALLPEGLAPLTLALISAASFCTSFITAAFGIGGGVAMLAILASLLPPAALIPVHGLVQFASNAGRAATLRPHIQRGPLLPFLVGSTLGAATGGLVAVELPPAAVEIGIGLFVLWSALFTPPKALRAGAGPAGFVSTLLTMFFGATGPFVAAYVKTLSLGRMEHVATHAAMMTAQHLLKVIAFGFLGFAFGPWLLPVALMAATGFLGTLAGKRALMRIDDRMFKRALAALLCLLAARLIWSGAADLL
ncbi:sulfite exporter TauE/SafE family protein [Albimonas sp. CAU 1670]|uniref:sulfite exporter TauE/SafE family protein n=1 Tax=Albimonas sp. CAU 1670 TaxID=3032599 RepID=UPI0023DB8A4D|nr:sulfite exporter TauE/SafE family protein [Albimonas sp. CAU 1670]MDF2235611.1 sulfite exporter TauE/SafE family protein [Albimonas sp. CAU 1670]